MRSDLDNRIAEARAQLSAHNNPIPPDDVLTKQVLETLILESLQMQLADRAGIHVDDNMLNQQMTKIAEQNKMTLAQFSQELNNVGRNYTAVREQVRREMTISELRHRQINQRARISDQEVDRTLSNKSKQGAYEYHLASIVMRPPTNTSCSISKAQQLANDVFNDAKSGISFSQLAAAHSTAPNAKSGGDLGWRKETQLSPNAVRAITGLAVGGISPPFQDGPDITVIKLIEKRSTPENGAPTSVNNIHARHILITPSIIRSDAQSKELITEIKTKIDQGVDFAKLAEKYSDDPSSASAGGDLGWSTPQKFTPEFSKEVETMPINKVSNPFKTKFGWHIVEVLERKNKDNAVAKVKDTTLSSMKKQKYEDELKIWLRQIRQEAFVDIKLK